MIAVRRRTALYAQLQAVRQMAKLTYTPQDNGSETLLTELEENDGNYTAAHKAQPQMSAVANGLGSVIHVSCPPRTAIFTRSDAVIAHSQHAALAFSPVGNPLTALLRMLGGGPFLLYKFKSADRAVDALLAPPSLGDVAVLTMDGTEDYCIRPSAYIASTTPLGLRVPISGMLHSAVGTHVIVHGAGSLAISAGGGLFRLVLKEDEQYDVAAKHLVAWQASMAPQSDKVLTQGEVVLPWYRKLLASIKERLSRSSSHMCRLEGPGEFYLSSHAVGALSASLRSRMSSLVPSADNIKERVVTITKTPTPTADAPKKLEN